MGSDAVVGYAQAEPTEAAAINALQELVGLESAVAIWEWTCERAQVLPPVWELPALLMVAELLTASEDPLARVAGRSIVIRIVTYSALSEKGLLSA
ncbi:MAG: hypothetical protein ABI595_16085 [Actinomycetota bacterium]